MDDGLVYVFADIEEKTGRILKMLDYGPCILSCINDKWILQENVVTGEVCYMDSIATEIEKRGTLFSNKKSGLISKYKEGCLYYDRRTNNLYEVSGENVIFEHEVIVDIKRLYNIYQESNVFSDLVQEIELFGLRQFIEKIKL